MQARRSPRSRGFTLVELVVTIAVFALLLFAALPSLGTWTDNTRIRNVASSLLDGLQLARAEAIRRNQNVSFWLVNIDNPAVLSNDCTLSNTSGSWVVSVNSPITHCADAPSIDSSPMLVTGRAVGDAGGRVSVTAVLAGSTTAATSVTFNGFGRLVNTADAIGQIDITGPTSGTDYRNLRLLVSPAGQVRMCDPDSGIATTDPRRC
ncbi:type IV fimbrial biogenesis protein FimT [Variovorax boronicumulans]|uniref:GspH/FimT family pseudopilin n=1 Tax=Variovorax boronicumulans TaxID=436515 RepID=UPI0027845332|nr:GspH/FimT family pseudopilin [Variovorax boronicumulans]MDP9914700.1 type IV fimbrial biogenesis protein FimT [Variovorax boronicumulans]